MEALFLLKVLFLKAQESCVFLNEISSNLWLFLFIIYMLHDKCFTLISCFTIIIANHFTCRASQHRFNMLMIPGLSAKETTKPWTINFLNVSYHKEPLK